MSSAVATPSQPAQPQRLTRVRRSTRSSYVGLAVSIVLIVTLAIGPFAFLTKGNQQNLVTLFVYIILGTMWNLLAGYAGMVSIGQQAFIGIGAYGIVYAADILGVGLYLAIPIALVISGVIAYLVSFLAFRLSGGYFAIGTWVIAEVIKLVTTQVQTLGAGSGISLTAFKGYKPEIRIAIIYWIALAAVVLSVAVTYLLLRSRLGTGFTAVRDDATAASTLGVNVTLSKRIVWVVSAMGCGLAGSLLAMSTLNVQPDSVFSVKLTAFMIFIVVIGGIGTIEGPILGAIVFFALEQWLGNIGVWYLVILGTVAIVMVLFAPKGLWGLISRDGRLQLFPTGLRLVTPLPATLSDPPPGTPPTPDTEDV